jgi:hypothetical protein
MKYLVNIIEDRVIMSSPGDLSGSVRPAQSLPGSREGCGPFRWKNTRTVRRLTHAEAEQNPLERPSMAVFGEKRLYANTGYRNTI